MNRRLFAAVLIAVTVSAGATESRFAAGATPPLTLTGELLVDAAPIITATCNPNGTSTVTFSASGPAAGPYPGTFTEVGVATIGPQVLSPGGGQSIGPLLSFDAVFMIASGTTSINGTKSLSLPVTNPAIQVSIGQCNTFTFTELVDVIAREVVTYQAQIDTAEGSFADRGAIPLVAVQRVRQLDETPIRIIFQAFVEDFRSDLTTPEPLTTPGHATGGGQVPADATFGFNAKSDANGTKGTCTVIDRATSTTVKCLDVTSYAQSGTHATFSGNAHVNGVLTTYRIDVDDLTEAGAGSDRFVIRTASGYSAGGVLTQGNIQVH